MNLYLRYFDQETLVTSVDDAIGFLKSIPEIEMDAELEADVREYAASDLTYPKRYKVRPRVYFIVIKTTAQTMQDFKDKRSITLGMRNADMITTEQWLSSLVVGNVTRMRKQALGSPVRLEHLIH